jgi:hypothetical protein
MKAVVVAILVAIASMLAPRVAPAQTPPNVFICVDNLVMPKTTKAGSPQILVVNNCLGIIGVGFFIARDVSSLTKTQSLTEVSIIKFVDNVLSPWLTMSGLTGSRWDKVTVQVFDPGCTPGGTGCAPLFLIEMGNVIVTGVATSGNSGGNATESVLLAYDSVKVQFPQQ